MKDRIQRILEDALEEIRPMLSESVAFSADLKLAGNQGCLDSMALVAFIVTVEDLLAAEFGQEIKLVNDRAFSKGNSPFYSISTFSKFIEELEQGANR